MILGYIEKAVFICKVQTVTAINVTIFLLFDFSRTKILDYIHNEHLEVQDLVTTGSKPLAKSSAPVSINCPPVQCEKPYHIKYTHHAISTEKQYNKSSHPSIPMDRNILILELPQTPTRLVSHTSILQHHKRPFGAIIRQVILFRTPQRPRVTGYHAEACGGVGLVERIFIVKGID